MDLGFLTEYAIPVVIGICLCVGYLIKTSIPKIPNNLIPVIVAVLGLVLNIWVAGVLSPEVILGGLFSGLASTGLYELFRNLISTK